ncbi:hypothetical protein SDC9_93460 [bioreactor metagenome]|uniref:Uncharacterized protein n=1 Tax=bioreactor metagenome TaxID=1076179 RepID=A0A645AAP6_9ZZZZ
MEFQPTQTTVAGEENVGPPLPRSVRARPRVGMFDAVRHQIGQFTCPRYLGRSQKPNAQVVDLPGQHRPIQLRGEPDGQFLSIHPRKAQVVRLQRINPWRCNAGLHAFDKASVDRHIGERLSIRQWLPAPWFLNPVERLQLCQHTQCFRHRHAQGVLDLAQRQLRERFGRDLILEQRKQSQALVVSDSLPPVLNDLDVDLGAPQHVEGGAPAPDELRTQVTGHPTARQSRSSPREQFPCIDSSKAAIERTRHIPNGKTGQHPGMSRSLRHHLPRCHCLVSPMSTVKTPSPHRTRGDSESL